MVNEIIKAMAKRLGEKFPDCRVFAEGVPQGFKEPCFQIECTEIKNGRFLGKRHKSENRFEIRYYTNNGRMDCNDVMLELFRIFELIETENGKIAGTNMTMEKGNDCMCFGVSYNFFFVYGDEDEKEDMPFMESYEQEFGE